MEVILILYSNKQEAGIDPNDLDQKAGPFTQYVRCDNEECGRTQDLDRCLTAEDAGEAYELPAFWQESDEKHYCHACIDPIILTSLKAGGFDRSVQGVCELITQAFLFLEASGFPLRTSWDIVAPNLERESKQDTIDEVRCLGWHQGEFTYVGKSLSGTCHVARAPHLFFLKNDPAFKGCNDPVNQTEPPAWVPIDPYTELGAALISEYKGDFVQERLTRFYRRPGWQDERAADPVAFHVARAFAMAGNPDPQRTDLYALFTDGTYCLGDRLPKRAARHLEQSSQRGAHVGIHHIGCLASLHGNQ
jgi:hypothetical protein